ncbi:hypothetical protein [Sphingomonas faeni]|uniref:hypothetical protein n=1 Tax=Sphingomonas faeni TaxID=185950 RepID=UPI0020C13131|nr:hypothetical protein [Sphingomonas faeni]MCK8455251.1 hypothetical protein [Sphingomonas faeni]
MTGMIGDLRDTLLASIATEARLMMPADDRAPIGTSRRRCREYAAIMRPHTAAWSASCDVRLHARSGLTCA